MRHKKINKGTLGYCSFEFNNVINERFIIKSLQNQWFWFYKKIASNLEITLHKYLWKGSTYEKRFDALVFCPNSDAVQGESRKRGWASVVSMRLKYVKDNPDVVDNQQLSRAMRYFSTAVRTDYLAYGNPDIQRFIFGGEGTGPSNIRCWYVTYCMSDGT